MKKQTITNHHKLWQGIVDKIKAENEVDIYLKGKVFQQLWPGKQIIHSCWLCLENFDPQFTGLLSELKCKCPLLKRGSCDKYDKYANACLCMDTKKALKLAEEIRDIV